MNLKLKIYFIVAFALFAKATTILGQNIFQKRSQVDSINFLEYNSVFSSDTGFFILGTGRSITKINDQIEITSLRNFFTWYNWNGDLIKHREFHLPQGNTYRMWHSANTIINSGIYHYAPIFDSLNNFETNYGDVLIKKFDWNGDTIWTKRYDSGLSDLSEACVPTINGGVGIGSTYTDNYMKQRVIRFDSLGNIIWNRTYNQTGRESYAKYIVGDPEGNFYISGYARPNGGLENARLRILKINGDGDILWNKIMPGICDEFEGPIAIADDGNILLAKFDCANQNGSGIDSNVGLYKINKNTGDTLWKQNYPNYSVKSTARPYFLRQLSNGDILLGGTNLKIFTEQQDTLFGNYVGELICTNSNGNLKWQRYYYYYDGEVGGNDACYFTDGKEAPDGGFILVGRTNSPTWQDGWIVKIDANGCIDMSCVNGVEELNDEDFRLFIYPNPATDYVSIDIPITHIKATLQIYTLQGKLVKTEAINGGGLQNFNLIDLPNGVYQLMVSASNGKLLGREKLVVIR